MNPQLNSKTCPTCQSCEPWILYECVECKHKAWVCASLSRSHCGRCEEQLQQQVRQLARLLLVTGHEPYPNHRYYNGELQLQRQARDQNKELITVRGIECSRLLLVPYIWEVPSDRWEQTKIKCTKRFAWKRKTK